MEFAVIIFTPIPNTRSVPEALADINVNRRDTDAFALWQILGPPICAVFVDSFSFLTVLFDLNRSSYESAPNSGRRHSVPKHKVAPVTSTLLHSGGCKHG